MQFCNKVTEPLNAELAVFYDSKSWSKEDEIKKASSSLVRRAIAGVVIFLLPTIITSYNKPPCFLQYHCILEAHELSSFTIQLYIFSIFFLLRLKYIK